MHDPEHDIVSEDAHDTKDNCIREQLAHHRHEHIHSCRLQPFIACPELDLTTDSVHRNQQNDHLEKDKEKRIAQINGIIQIRVEQRVATGSYR